MQDLRLAFRALLAAPVVSAVAILSLALGIGANTAIFSLVDSLMLRALPVKDPGRLYLVSWGTTTFGANSWTNPQWEQLRPMREVVDKSAAWSSTRFNLAQGGETEYVEGVWASGSYFDTFGVPPLLGRMLTEADDARGGGRDGPATVISYAFWQRHFGGAPDAIGRTLTIERVPFTVVGVAPPEFFGADVGRTFDVVVPLGCEPLVRGKDSGLDRRSMWWLNVIVRLRPDQSEGAGVAALRGVQPQIREATQPADWPADILKDYLRDPYTLLPAATGSSFLRIRYQRPLLTLLVVVALVLLIACANIANLLLARATARRHELSVRIALGASRWRLARQLLVESLVLAGAGTALGLLFAGWASRMLVAQLSTQVNRVFLDLSLDWRVMAFTAAVCMATALLFGTAPAFRASRAAPMDAMKEQGRGTSGDRRSGVAGGLVVAQVALSLVLVVGAALFVRTFSALANLHLGFERDRILIVNVNAIKSRTPQNERIALFERVRQAVLALPGVADAATSVVTPVSNSTWNNAIVVSGAVPLPERQNSSFANWVSPRFLTTYGTPLVAGRDITADDRVGTPSVAVVNEAFARKFLNGASPLGHTVRYARTPIGRPNPPRLIVGVAADAVYRNLRDPMPATMYLPLAQYEDTSFMLTSVSISVRVKAGSPSAPARAIAGAIGDVDRDLALTFRPLADQVNAALIQERLVAMLSGFFGALALLLAGLGLYGVTSYAVSRRRTEIGIRMALGAAPGGVVRLVLGRVAILVAAGVVIGAIASVWAAHFVEALLYGMQPRDPLTFAGAAAALAVVGAVAGWLPARRASRIDPAAVLRES